MVLSERSNGHCTGRTRYHVDLVRLQAVCDANYHRLRRLAPEGAVGVRRSLMMDVQGHSASVQLEIREQTPYTTVLQLTLVTPLHNWLEMPRLTVRMYHDVRMAEVIAVNRFRNLRARYSYPNPDLHQPDEKHQLNTLLAEWLEHCLSTGYIPDPVIPAV